MRRLVEFESLGRSEIIDGVSRSQRYVLLHHLGRPERAGNALEPKVA